MLSTYANREPGPKETQKSTVEAIMTFVAILCLFSVSFLDNFSFSELLIHALYV